MKTTFSAPCLFLAILLGLAGAALGQGNTMSVIDLSTKAVTTFVACNEPAAVVWAAVVSVARCDCDQDDEDHDGEHHDGAHCDGDHHDGERHKDHRGDRVRRASHDRNHEEGDHDDDDRCECRCECDHEHQHESRASRWLHDDEDEDECVPPKPTISNGLAYAVCDTDSSLIRIDLSTPAPTITAVHPMANLGPSALAIDQQGTHALVSGDAPTVSYLDLTKTPFQELGPITPPLLANGFPQTVADVAFYGTSKGVIVTENNVYVVDLTSTPPGNVLATIALNSPPATVAVDAANNRAVVSLDLGGVQVVNLTTNSLVGPELGDSGDTLGVAIAPAGTPAVAVYESSSSTSPRPYAMVVSVGATPAVTGTVPLASTPRGPNDLIQPSAVAFNPVTSEALIVGDDGIAVLKPPYASVDSTIRYPTGFSGTTKHGIAASPDGKRALIVNEDAPFPPVPIAPSRR